MNLCTSGGQVDVAIAHESDKEVQAVLIGEHVKRVYVKNYDWKNTVVRKSVYCVSRCSLRDLNYFVCLVPIVGGGGVVHIYVADYYFLGELNLDC